MGRMYIILRCGINSPAYRMKGELVSAMRKFYHDGFEIFVCVLIEIVCWIW